MLLLFVLLLKAHNEEKRAKITQFHIKFPEMQILWIARPYLSCVFFLPLDKHTRVHGDVLDCAKWFPKSVLG